MPTGEERSRYAGVTQRGVPRSGVWSEVETRRSGTSGGAGEEAMDGQRAVAERNPPARDPASCDLQRGRCVSHGSRIGAMHVYELRHHSFVGAGGAGVTNFAICMNGVSRSIGTGKMVVELFSEATSRSVWR